MTAHARGRCSATQRWYRRLAPAAQSIPRQQYRSLCPLQLPKVSNRRPRTCQRAPLRVQPPRSTAVATAAAAAVLVGLAPEPQGSLAHGFGATLGQKAVSSGKRTLSRLPGSLKQDGLVRTTYPFALYKHLAAHTVQTNCVPLQLAKRLSTSMQSDTLT